ncbi:hypothetical protein VCHENC02_1098A, partial [Vibrio harveyi]
MQSSE